MSDQKKLDPEILNNWANVRLGHEALMLDKIQKQNQIVNDTVRGQQRELGYEVTDMDEDMGVSIGNKVTHIHQSAPEPVKKASSLLGPALVAGSVLASGGVGAAGMAALSYLTKSETVNQMVPLDKFPGADPGFGEVVWKDSKYNKDEEEEK